VHITPSITEAQLIFAKVRVAPLQERSIPQLELLAAVVGKRAVSYVRKALDLSIIRTTLWTDATTVLQWLSSPAVQPQFVQNRLTELRKAENITFRYTPTKDNPADILSRGQKASTLQNNSLWWLGPSWLTTERLWPVQPPNASKFSTVLSAKIVTLAFRHTKVQTHILSDSFETRYATWDKCIDKILRLWSPLRVYYTKKLKLTHATMRTRAELVLIRLIQSKYFSTELDHLRND